jgi:hypothetical protein
MASGVDLEESVLSQQRKQERNQEGNQEHKDREAQESTSREV